MTHYDVLGVAATATLDEIKRAYRNLAKKFHPDLYDGKEKIEAEDRIRLINNAYEVLGDEAKRAEYNAILAKSDPKFHSQTQKPNESSSKPQQAKSQQGQQSQERQNPNFQQNQQQSFGNQQTQNPYQQTYQKTNPNQQAYTNQQANPNQQTYQQTYTNQQAYNANQRFQQKWTYSTPQFKQPQQQEYEPWKKTKARSTKKRKLILIASFAVILVMSFILVGVFSNRNNTPTNYSVSYAAGVGGTIEGTTAQKIKKGMNAESVIAKANNGFEFLSWSDGISTQRREDKGILQDISVIAEFKPIGAFMLTYFAGIGGSLEGETTQHVLLGENALAVTAVPAEGYEFSGWSDGLKTAIRTDSNINKNISVQANFAKKKYNATYNTTLGGSVNPAGTQRVEHGGSITVVATPDEGYNFSEWSDGVKTATRTDKEVKSNFSVQAIFVAKVYFYATYTASTGGSVSVTGPQKVEQGKSITVTAIPDDGYKFSEWSDGVKTIIRTDKIERNLSVRAIFVEKIYYSVTYTANVGGSVSLAVPQIIEQGESITVTAIPDDDYNFSEWSDGVKTATRTDKIEKLLSVQANFVKKVYYSVLYTASVGGSVSLSNIQKVEHGKSLTVTAIPIVGYSFTKWSDGVTTATRTDSNITRGFTVEAEFIKAKYSVKYTASIGGSISLPDPLTIEHGESITVVATPSYGYNFIGWSDGVTTATRTDSNITSSFTVEAEFIKVKHSVKYTASAGGSVSLPDPLTIGHGESITVVATPSYGYNFIGWSDGVTTATRTDKIEKSLSAKANFEKIKYTVTYSADEGGTVSLIGPQTVEHGNSLTVTAEPKTGYSFSEWSDGKTTAQRTDSNIKNGFSVHAKFVKIKYNVTFTAGTGGSVSLSGTKAIEHGESITVTATPDTANGYEFLYWSDGTTDAERNETVTSVINITAIFSRFAGGEGTSKSPYLIKTQKHLSNIAYEPSAHYILGADIMLADFEMITLAEKNFHYYWHDEEEPIGGFNGVLDGKNYSIKGVNSTKLLYKDGDSIFAGGIFDYIATDGIVKNLKLSVDFDVNVTENCKQLAIGGLAALSRGKVENCTVRGNIKVHYSFKLSYNMIGGLVGEAGKGGFFEKNESLVIIEVSAEDKIIKPTLHLGGIVGAIYGAIIIGDISSANININIPNISIESGGVVGEAFDSEIKECRFDGKITAASVSGYVEMGGVVGYALNTKVSNLSSVGVIEYNAKDYEDIYFVIGGIVAYASSSYAIDYNNLNSQANINIKALAKENGYLGTEVGGIFGYVRNNKIYNSKVSNSIISIDIDLGENYSEGSCDIEVGGFVGNSFDSTYTECWVENIKITVNAKNVYYMTVGGFVGYADDSYNNCKVISSSILVDVENVSYIVEGAFVGETSEGASLINCEASKSIVSLIIDGKSSQYYENTYIGGFVGRDGSATVYNCRVIDSEIIVNGNEVFMLYVGGFTGGGYAGFDSCKVLNTQISYNSNSVGQGAVGGFGGVLYTGDAITNIVNCEAQTKIIVNVFDMDIEIGGFVGSTYFFGEEVLTISNCKATGTINVTAVNIADMFTDDMYIGGFVGNAYGGKFVNCEVQSTITLSDTLFDAKVHTGGFVGYVSGGSTFVTCSVKSDISIIVSYEKVIFNVGGFAGYTDDAIFEDCFVEETTITVNNKNSEYASSPRYEYEYLDVGGFVGYSLTSNYDSCKVINNSITLEMDKTNLEFLNVYVGGFVAYSSGSTFTACLVIEVAIPENGENSNNISIKSLGKINPYVGGFAGYLSQSNISKSDATNKIILDIKEVYDSFVSGFVSYLSNGATYFISECSANVDIYIDIDIAPDVRPTIIGGFAGRFVYGQILDSSSNATMELYLVRNEVGGFCGNAYQGTMTNCTAASDIKIFRTASLDVGGFVGKGNFGEFYNCTVEKSLISIKYETINSYNVGGFVGNSGNIYNDCKVLDVSFSITGYEIKNIGAIGGFVGYGSDKIYINCYSKSSLVIVQEKGSIEIGGFAGSGVGFSASGCVAESIVNVTCGNSLISFGGFIGDTRLNSNITNSSASTTATIQGTYSIYSCIGGFVGEATATKLDKCAITGTIKAVNTANKGALVGKTNSGVEITNGSSSGFSFI